MAVTKKDYVIPLRKGFGPCAPHKKTPKAIRVLKAFVVRHSKVDEKDVKIGAELNKLIWANSIRNPPAKVAVSITVDNGVAKVELQGVDYKEAPKMQAKKEPETLKDKIQEKIGVKADKEEAVQAAKAEKKAEPKVEAKKPEAKEKPVAKSE